MILRNYTTLRYLPSAIGKGYLYNSALKSNGIKITSGDIWPADSSSGTAISNYKLFYTSDKTNRDYLASYTESTKANNSFGSSGLLMYQIILASGATGSPSYTDYCLSGTQITDLTVINQYLSNDTIPATVVGQYQNNTESDITINEIGLLVRISELFIESSSSSSTYEYTWQPVLLTRDVLATPITVEPGKMVTVSISI